MSSARHGVSSRACPADPDAYAVHVAYDEVLADRVREVLGTLAPAGDVHSRTMFGGIAFMVRGTMAVGVSGQGGLMLRVPPEQRDELAVRPHARPFEMRGKVLAGWLRIGAAGVGDDDQLRAWVEIGVDHALTMPPR